MCETIEGRRRAVAGCETPCWHDALAVLHCLEPARSHFAARPHLPKLLQLLGPLVTLAAVTDAATAALGVSLVALAQHKLCGEQPAGGCCSAGLPAAGQSGSAAGRQLQSRRSAPNVCLRCGPGRASPAPACQPGPPAPPPCRRRSSVEKYTTLRLGAPSRPARPASW